MKRVIFMMLIVLSLTGCLDIGVTEENLVNNLSEKYQEKTNYQVTAVMEIKKGENKNSFDITIFRKGENYKVTMKNKSNNNTQAIIKNSDGVFVITPTLNKSFKFQSTWPLNTYHGYLVESIVKEIANDENTVITSDDQYFTIESKVVSKTNPRMVSQKVIIDRETLNPVEVIVYNENMEVEAKIVFKEFDYDVEISDDEFNVEKSMETAIMILGEGEVSTSFQEPLESTYVVSGSLVESTIITEETSITVFAGEQQYTIVQTVADADEVMHYSHIYDEVVILSSGIGALSESSLTWYQDGIECAVYSKTLSDEEMIAVANSLE